MIQHETNEGVDTVGQFIQAIVAQQTQLQANDPHTAARYDSHTTLSEGGGFITESGELYIVLSRHTPIGSPVITELMNISLDMNVSDMVHIAIRPARYEGTEYVGDGDILPLVRNAIFVTREINLGLTGDEDATFSTGKISVALWGQISEINQYG